MAASCQQKPAGAQALVIDTKSASPLLEDQLPLLGQLVHALTLSQSLKCCSSSKAPFTMLQGPVDPGTACSALAQAKVVFKLIQEGTVHMRGGGFQQVIWQLLTAGTNLIILALKTAHAPCFTQCSCKSAPHAHAPQEREPHFEGGSPGKVCLSHSVRFPPEDHMHAAG